MTDATNNTALIYGINPSNPSNINRTQLAIASTVLLKIISHGVVGSNNGLPLFGTTNTASITMAINIASERNNLHILSAQHICNE